MEQVILYREWFGKGEEVPPPESTTMAFLTCLAVFSRSGRNELLALTDTMRSNRTKPNTAPGEDRIKALLDDGRKDNTRS